MALKLSKEKKERLDRIFQTFEENPLNFEGDSAELLRIVRNKSNFKRWL